MKYVQTDSNDKIIGYYDDKIAPPPEGSEEITPEKWQQALNDGSSHFKSGNFDLVVEPLTDIQIISNTLTNILIHMDKIFIEEYEKPIYFHGMGFGGSNSGRYAIGNAILNATTFPNNEDTIKLANWRYDCYGKFKEWRVFLVKGTMPTSTYTNEYVEENLPNVENY
jgi:hypothetical protein